MSQIITFSSKAKMKLKEISKEIRNKDILGLRISVKSGGCAGMTYEMTYIETEHNGDEKIKLDDINIYIDPKAIIYLLGTEMDYKINKFSSSFIFNNPNETERCGCGESFKI